MAQADEKYVSPSELAPTLDGAGLIAEAKKRKERANDFFGSGLYDAAMQSYLVGIWYLKVSRPSYPEVLSGQVPPSDVEASRMLGHGTERPQPPPAPAPTAAAKPQSSRVFRVGLGTLGCAWLVGVAAVLVQAATHLERGTMAIVFTTAMLPCAGVAAALWWALFGAESEEASVHC